MFRATYCTGLVTASLHQVAARLMPGSDNSRPSGHSGTSSRSNAKALAGAVAGFHSVCSIVRSSCRMGPLNHAMIVVDQG